MSLANNFSDFLSVLSVFSRERSERVVKKLQSPLQICINKEIWVKVCVTLPDLQLIQNWR